MSLHYLVYVSSSVRLMKDDELAELLSQARKNNAQSNITGMLLYKDGGFMQLIEGEEEAVSRLHEKILKDSRHRGVITLLEGALEKRQFGQWSMAFTNVDSLAETERAGFSSFLTEPLNVDYFGTHPHHALKLLLSFKKNYEKR